MIKVILLAAALLLVVTTPAHAYIDPGTGTFLVQILAAIFFGALFYLRRVRNFFVRLFRTRQQKEKKSDGPE